MDLQANGGARVSFIQMIVKKLSCGSYTVSERTFSFWRVFVLELFLHLSPFSVFVSLCFFFLSLLQALVNTNSFCQGICGCVWIETETWEHWACLLLIEYAWLGLPGAVSDEKRMKMLMFVELSWILKDLFNLLASPKRVQRRTNELLCRWKTYLSPHI